MMLNDVWMTNVYVGVTQKFEHVLNMEVALDETLN